MKFLLDKIFLTVTSISEKCYIFIAKTCNLPILNLIWVHMFFFSLAIIIVLKIFLLFSLQTHIGGKLLTILVTLIAMLNHNKELARNYQTDLFSWFEAFNFLAFFIQICCLLVANINDFTYFILFTFYGTPPKFLGEYIDCRVETFFMNIPELVRMFYTYLCQNL